MNKLHLQSVIDNMNLAGIPCLLVSSPASVAYLTGQWIHPGERMLALMVKNDGTVRLFANRLFALTESEGLPLTEYDDTDDCVAVLAGGVRPGVLGIDKAWPSHFTIRLMEARPDVKPALGSAPVDDARMIKDAEELDLMRVSSQKNVTACRRTAEALREGMTEREGQALYKRFAAELGSEGVSFTPLVCFGKNGAEPHHDSDDTPLRQGDTVILDVGLLWKRYCSDMTRTVHFGPASDEQKRVYDIVKAANRAGIAACKPGVLMKDIDRAARKVIEDAGYGKYFTHRTGHGIGLDEHEFPDCSSVSETVTRPA